MTGRGSHKTNMGHHYIFWLLGENVGVRASSPSPPDTRTLGAFLGRSFVTSSSVMHQILLCS